MESGWIVAKKKFLILLIGLFCIDYEKSGIFIISFLPSDEQ